MKRTKNDKTENLLWAITSGILTSTISKFVQEDTQSTIWRIILTLGMFCIIWALLSFIIPELVSIFKRKIQFHFGKIYSNTEIVELFYSTEKDIVNIIEKYNRITSSNNSCTINTLILSSDIIICVDKLYLVFCGKHRIQKATVNSVFRDYTVTKDIRHKISKYEYDALINNVDDIVDKIYSCNKSDNKDYSNLKKKINELKRISIKKQSNHE